ncbi:hypothetical protein DVS28_b0175 (plasmid) [Euzebya pacifica]|uniref:Uncharacterized protein n=1 Tax=Euzebya pacifica TaxID=1608957 RepID=A0A346Y648_9ACTN|nr:hypothetical protein [Euzebya pacifica]AXV09945.1 hypothetical protein DVS28_b0175 [Euzebya pacifica]
MTTPLLSQPLTLGDLPIGATVTWRGKDRAILGHDRTTGEVLLDPCGEGNRVGVSPHCPVPGSKDPTPVVANRPAGRTGQIVFAVTGGGIAYPDRFWGPVPADAPDTALIAVQERARAHLLADATGTVPRTVTGTWHPLTAPEGAA